MTANNNIYDSLTRHQLYLLRTANSIYNNMMLEVDKTNPALKALLQKKNKLVGMGKLTKSYQDELKLLDKQIAEIRNVGFLEAKKISKADFIKLAENEQLFVDKAIKSSIPFEIATETLKKNEIVNIIAFSQFSGDSLSEWYRKWQVNDLNRISTSIKFDLSQGLSLGEIERNLFGTKKAGYKDGVIQGTRNDAARLARTVTNGVSNDSKQEYYKANDDIIKQVLFSAVFDGRTSIICASYGGKVFDVYNAPQLPLHPYCRSLLVPIIDGVAIIGRSPTITGRNFRKEAKEDYIRKRKNQGDNEKTAKKKWNNLSSSYKNTLLNKKINAYSSDVIGSIPAETTYNDWLKKQPKSFQDDVLGKTRADIFREKGITLSEMMNANNTKPLSVDELKDKL